MLRVGCRLCGSDAIPFCRTQDWNRGLSDRQFDYYRCARCGVIFVSPIPSNLSAYYPTDYYTIPDSLQQLAAGAGAERYKIEIVRSYCAGGRLLEIGPASGGFAYLAKRAGFTVDTVEMDAACCAFLQDVVGVRAIHSEHPADVLRAGPTYDVIALWHVIEHLPDPWDLVAAAAVKLSPQGVLVIAAPNPASFQFRLFGSYWTHLDAPRHLQLIPIAELTQRARALGMLPRMATTADRGTLAWNTFGWQYSLANWLRSRSRKLPVRKVGRALSLAARPVERSGLRGSTYTLVFVRAA